MAKIKPLNKDLQGVSDKVIVDKINEIIEVLNSSFITLDPHTSVDVLDTVAKESRTQCDRLTSLLNETICELTVDHLADMVKGVGIYDNIECPKCGAKYFEVGSSYCTAVNYPTIIKDGVNINPDRNKSTTSYTCCECGHRWEE